MSMSYVAGVPEMPLVDHTIGQVLEHAASHWTEDEALIVPHQDIRWTWAELDERVDALARGLIRSGFEPGDRIGIWATNQWEWIVTQYATAKVGVILVNINPAYRVHELEFVLNNVTCKGLVTGARFKSSDYIGMTAGAASRTEQQ